MVQAIVGANWGDEGKGKITDMLATRADVIVRFQGGANAGHTIINQYGKHALHLLPSGVFNIRATNVIGNGVALDIDALQKELKQILNDGVPHPKLIISDRTQILMPYHKLQDAYEEARLSDRQFGSTKSGIAPFYADKYAKIGFQVAELFDLEAFRIRLLSVLEVKNLLFRELYHQPELDIEELMAKMAEWADFVRPFVRDTRVFLRDALKSKKSILLEGQLGSLKDPDFGIYPMVTSSHTIASFAAVGAGIPAAAITEVLAVTKAYSSAVGAGPFVSELFGEEAEELRKRGGDAGEYGATTGRPRRVGWFDAVATKYGVEVQGATAVALTNLDCLSYLDTLNICIGYEIDGKVTAEFPAPALLERAKPIWKEMKGFATDIRGVRVYDALPKEAKQYVATIEALIGVPITMVSNGPAREEILPRKSKLKVD